MKFASSAKGRGTLQAKATSRVAYGIAAQAQGKPYKDNWDVDRAIREGLNRSIWVLRSVHAIADNQARQPIEVAQGAEDGPVIPGHFWTTLLNQAPNEDESAYTFRYRLSTTLLLSRKGAFIETVRSRGGEIVEAYLLDPRKTHPIPGTKRLVDGFAVETGPGKFETLKTEDVVWVRLPHPLDPLAGITPMEAAGISIDTDALARLYNRTFLQNDGRPGGIVGVKGDMDDDVADELEARFNGGTKGAGRVTVLEADGLDWVDTATSPRDAQYVESRKLTKEDILGAFGVPESVAIANASQRTYENADAEKEIFWESTMLGHLALLGDGLNRSDQDPNTFVRFDLSGVEALQRAVLRKRTEMREEVAAGLRTLDSYLEETGREPLGTDEARSYFQPMGMVPIATEGKKAPVVSLVDAAVAKAVNAHLEGKGVVAPFRYVRPRAGG